MGVRHAPRGGRVPAGPASARDRLLPAIRRAVSASATAQPGGPLARPGRVPGVGPRVPLPVDPRPGPDDPHRRRLVRVRAGAPRLRPTEGELDAPRGSPRRRCAPRRRPPTPPRAPRPGACPTSSGWRRCGRWSGAGWPSSCWGPWPRSTAFPSGRRRPTSGASLRPTSSSSTRLRAPAPSAASGAADHCRPRHGMAATPSTTSTTVRPKPTGPRVLPFGDGRAGSGRPCASASQAATTRRTPATASTAPTSSLVDLDRPGLPRPARPGATGDAGPGRPAAPGPQRLGAVAGLQPQARAQLSTPLLRRRAAHHAAPSRRALASTWRAASTTAAP